MSIETTSSVSETCIKPEELFSIYLQWKMAQPNLWEERRLIEPLRIFIFGIHLAQEVYPFSKRFPNPPIKIDQTGNVRSASLLIVSHGAQEIALNQSWLINTTVDQSSPATTPVFGSEDSFRLISTAVEEYAHWIHHKAIERCRSSLYIYAQDAFYDQTLEDFNRSLKRAHTGLNEIKSTGWLRYLYFLLTGKLHQQLRNAEIDLERAELALLANSTTIEEYMGVVWRNKVARKYFPWSLTAKKIRDEQAATFLNRKQVRS